MRTIIHDLNEIDLKKFSFNEIIEIKKLIKNSNINLILNAERLFSDNDLIFVKSLIKDNFFEMFEYVTYSDFGFKTLLEEEKVKIKYIFKASTYLTNYQDINEYSYFNDFIVASSEISSSELIELSKKINKNIIVDLFGKSACFYSRRELLSNYFKYRNAINDGHKDNYYIIEELRNDLMPIIENEIGTMILEPKFHLLLEELNEIEHAEYGIISVNNLKLDNSFIIVEAYNDFLNNKDINLFYQKLDDAKVPYYKGAYNIKSILLKGGSGCE